MMMHALRPSSLFRPSSRPSSPAPIGGPRSEGTIPDRTPRAINKLSSFTNFRRAPPLPGVDASPAPAIIQDGSYLEVLSLKLGETVSKALVNPLGSVIPYELLNGKRPIPPGRGRALGTLIETELNASREKPHLRKAILRTLQRPLSTLFTTLSSQLLPLLSCPAFHALPTFTAPAPNLNATQIHAIAFATFAGELLESLDSLGLGLDDGLRSVRENLVSVINRVLNPLVAGIKTEIISLISALEKTPNSATSNLSISKAGSKPNHPSIAALQTVMPVYARALTRLFSIPTTGSTLATLNIALVWRGLVAVSHRTPLAPSPPTTPDSTLTSISLKRNPMTPPTTPPASKFILKLPSSRPPSPPLLRSAPSPASDARALYEILSTLPRPGTDNPQEMLAREAVDDAFMSLHDLVELLEVDFTAPIWHIGEPAGLAYDLVDRTKRLPSLIALPVLLNALACPQNPTRRTIPSMLGMSEEEYRLGCLTGFGRVEECIPSVGQRVLDVLMAESDHTFNADVGRLIFTQWLKSEVELAHIEA